MTTSPWQAATAAGWRPIVPGHQLADHPHLGQCLPQRLVVLVDRTGEQVGEQS
ncbi:MAG: hypothetical protein R2755_23335 [Acidimicrobiales bacterium]